MDTSKEYIIMCRKAYEIQSLKIPLWGFCNFEVGDIFVTNQSISANQRYIFDGNQESQPKTDEKVVWLLRQDQLQDMLDLKGKWCFSTGLSPICKCEYGGGYDKEIDEELDYYDNFSSFEQSWLAFIMKEKYNKIWKDGTWQSI